LINLDLMLLISAESFVKKDLQRMPCPCRLSRFENWTGEQGRGPISKYRQPFCSRFQTNLYSGCELN
jgi:hypothetical protein